MNKDGRVGCAYYAVIDEALYIEEDRVMGGTEVAETFLLKIQPTTVLIPNRAPGPLVELLERNAQRLDEESPSLHHGSYVLRHLVSMDFDYDIAKDMLAALDWGPPALERLKVFPPEDGSINDIGSSKHGKLMKVASCINIDSHVAIGCAGAVLGDLDRRRAAEDSLDDEEEVMPFRVRSVKMMTPADALLASADALLSLHILRSEPHPNPQAHFSSTSESKAKEGLSIYKLLQSHACTAQGKAKLREMLFHPTIRLSLIKERQKTIATFLSPDNTEIVASIQKSLRKVKNTKALFRHVRMGVDRIRGQLSLRIGDWRALMRFAMVSAQIREAIPSFINYNQANILSKIHAFIEPRVFLSIGESILETIDFELSKEVGRTEIRRGVSEHLDELRERFSHVCHRLPEINENIRRMVPPWAVRHILYCTIIPELGFFIAVALDPESGEGAYAGENTIEGDWQLRFIHDKAAYYKNATMLNLDAQYGSLPCQIAEEEMNVVLRLSSSILLHEEIVTSAADLFGELDSLLALAMAAQAYNWTRPKMTLKNMLKIVDGRHPLQELLVPTFIPNDCRLAGGDGPHCLLRTNDARAKRPSMLVLTGPNNSGKSIYMRQVALIVYLAHIGSYVPASRAVVGLTDRILTRIATRETVARDESAFLVDLKQAAFAVNFATRRSLILVDEFGKGTNPETGAGLLAAYLANFLHIPSLRPKVLVGTHFHEIFEHGILRPEHGLKFVHMDVHLNPDAADPEDQITYLYKLRPGRATSSFGILCAAINDVDNKIIERARVLVNLQERNEDIEEAYLPSLPEEELQKLESAERIAKQFLALDISSGKYNHGDSLRDAVKSILAGTWEDD
ncbi:hypothetical protein OQA88_11717 [Cercophora sp. LCS_1]